MNELLQSLGMSPVHNAKILIAVGMGKHAIVISTDSEWVTEEVNVLGSDCDDLGVECEMVEGLHLWEGVLKMEGTQTMEGYEGETVYVGKTRAIEAHELFDLVRMEPKIDPLMVIEEETR
jgi:hypothetical protein